MGIKHVWADFFVGTITDRCSGKELSGGAKTVIAVYVGLTRGDVVPLQFLGENCFRNRYIAVEETLLMITDWKIRDAEKQAFKLKEIICK